MDKMKVAIVIPAFRVKEHILQVIEKVGPEVSDILVVDDCCPEGSGDFVRNNCADVRVRVIFNKSNKGVGGATISGYLEALKIGSDVVVKVDGDGQMDPALIPDLIHPILSGEADYTKGNRFFNLASLKSMPLIRLFGNSVLSFVSKLASGYWNVMDPTNGFTAIHASVLKVLPLEKIDERYFFESDMLFRLNTVRAVVKELPMEASYGCEKSGLQIHRIIFDFPTKYITCVFKRIFYNYYLRDFNFCSVQLLLGTMFMLFGMIFGGINWYFYYLRQSATPMGTIMIAALPVILGFQMLLAAINYDVMNVPREPFCRISKQGD